MKLRMKVTAIMTLAFAVFLVAALGIQRTIVLPSFAELERDHARRDLRRAEEAVQREVEHVAVLCRDWSVWDDSYSFVVGENDAYEAANLGPVTMEEAELNVLAFYDRAGRRVYGCVVGGADLEPLELPMFADDVLPAGHRFLLEADDEEGYSGVLDTPVAPLLIAVRPILTSEGKGPGRGTLVMGRLLDETRMQKIRELTRVPVTLHDAAGTDLPRAAAPLLGTLLDAPYDVALDEPSNDAILALGYLRDLDGEPLRILRAEIPRDITMQGKMAVGVAVGTLAITSALVLAVIVLFLQRVVIGPLTRLTAAATRIGESGDLDVSVATPRSDEIGVLSREVDAMVRRLASSRRALMDAARESGMAQVASGVLHNVGNVLNSLNVSADVLIDGVRRSEMRGLDDLERLLLDQGDDLAVFLSDPARAAGLRDFVSQLAELRRHEFDACEKELQRLQANLGHVAHIIGSQQSMARGRAVSERVSAAALLNESATMVAPAFRRHDIELVVEADNPPRIVVDRVHLMQVLVNLLTNAKEAVKANGAGERRVRMTARRIGADAVEFEVLDNGIGIDEETLPELFSQGFTTRDGGNGIGLHFCAVAVKGMSGEIEARSDGPGHGASFRVRLPLAASPATTEVAHV